MINTLYDIKLDLVMTNDPINIYFIMSLMHTYMYRRNNIIEYDKTLNKFLICIILKDVM